eukprot:gene20882-27725_t
MPRIAAGYNSPATFPAYGVLEKGAPLARWDYTPEPLGLEDIDIQVTHNALCHTDIHMRDDDWGISKFPFVPGHEIVGVVVAKGDNVTGVELGNRVGYAWIKNSCRSCKNCVSGKENICAKGYTGTITMGNNGGFGKYMRAPADFAYKLPDALDSVSAAPLLCAGLTVYAPLRRLITQPGCKVAIIGIGGLGHLAIQLASKMGAVVTAVSGSPSKEAEARALGASHFLLSANAEASFGTQEVVLNTISGAEGIDEQTKLSMALLEADGAFCMVGMPNVDLKISLLDLIANQKRVVGSIVGGRSDMKQMLEFCAAKDIKPMCEVMKLSQINEAMDKLAKNNVRYKYNSPATFPSYGCLEKGAPLVRWDYTPEPLGPGDIDIQVTHNALCHTDIHMRIVGVVVAKGDNVNGVDLGDRVGYAWIKNSCRSCKNCVSGKENICVKGYTGTITMGNNGGFGKYMRAPADFAYKLPDALDSVSAAPLLCAGLTVYAPLRRLITQPGCKVAIIGIGGLGHLAIQLASKMGAV